MAVALSIGATAVGFALAEGGSPRAALAGGVTMFVGPSVGQWYAGSIGGIGLATRGVALLAILRGVAMSDDVADGDCLGLSSADCAAFERAQERETHEANVLIYGGLALWGASTIYDFVAAHRAATRWNREHALAIAPLVPTASSRATGVALALRF
jgi:hypothetical protein